MEARGPRHQGESGFRLPHVPRSFGLPSRPDAAPGLPFGSPSPGPASRATLSKGSELYFILTSVSAPQLHLSSHAGLLVVVRAWHGRRLALPRRLLGLLDIPRRSRGVRPRVARRRQPAPRREKAGPACGPGGHAPSGLRGREASSMVGTAVMSSSRAEAGNSRSGPLFPGPTVSGRPAGASGLGAMARRGG